MDVFLSYSRADQAQAELLEAWLRAQGVTTFFDRRDLGGGRLWLPDLERHIETEARSVIVLLGPGGLGNTQQYEFQLALTRQAREPDFPVIPVVLPETQSWQLPRGFLGLQTWVNFTDETDIRAAPGELQRLLAAIRREPAGGDTIRGTICPFKGLEAFAEEDAGLFFGREAETDTLHDTIMAHRVAAVIGRSGSGKSSLARGGLLPRLRRRGETGWDTVWDSLVIRPGTDPLLALASALSPFVAGEDDQDRFRRLSRQANDWRDDKPDMLARFLTHRMEQSRLRVNRLLILVDQAEELFARPWQLREASAVRRFQEDGAHFINLLLEAANSGPASVVLTIRSDFFDPLMHSPFAPVLKDTLVQLGRITAIRPCIERPAAVVGLRFSPGLVDRIVDEVGADESNLPLLQHALQRTWQHREGALLSDTAYAQAGGVARAINQAAEAALAALPAEEQRAAKRLFLRLVSPGEGNSHLRVRAPAPTDPLERQVMEVFAAPERRLIFVGQEAGKPVVEVAHEALVRGWPTLLDWVETSRERLRARDEVMHWMARASPGAEPEPLPAGALLQRARDLLRDPGDVPVDDLRGFVERSVTRERRRRNRAFVAIGSVAVLFAGLSVVALTFWRTSVRDRDSAARSVALATDTANGLVFDIALKFANFGLPAATLKDIFSRALTLQDQLAAGSDVPAKLRASQAGALSQMSYALLGVGDAVGALAMAQQGRDISEALAAADPMNEYYAKNLAGVTSSVARALRDQGRLTEALEAFRKALALEQAILDKHKDDLTVQRDISFDKEMIGGILRDMKDIDGALVALREDVAMMKSVVEKAPDNLDWLFDLSESDNNLGDVLLDKPDLDAALVAFREGLAIRLELRNKDGNNQLWARGEAQSYMRMGDALAAKPEYAEALHNYQTAMKLLEQMARRDPSAAQVGFDLAHAYREVGETFASMGSYDDALDSIRKSIEVSRHLVASYPAEVDFQREITLGIASLGFTMAARGDTAGGLAQYQEAIDLLTKLLERSPANVSLKDDIADYEQRIAELTPNSAAKPDDQPANGKDRADGDLDDAVAAYGRHDYATSARLFQTLAAAGNAEAQGSLGRQYWFGQGVEQNYDEALHWAKKAAEQGNPRGQTSVGTAYYYGRGVKQDYHEAMKWYRRAADQKYGPAIVDVGLLYQGGHGVAADTAEAMRWFRKAADDGSPEGEWALGYAYESGLGVAEDASEALKWYRKAAEKGYSEAQNNLGSMYQTGEAVPQDYAAALDWYRKAAEQEHPDAQLNLGAMSEAGRGTKQDYAEAARWYRKAAAHDNAGAENALGNLYLFGHGVPEDNAAAMRWYRKAADQGSAEATANIGVLYENGYGVVKDPVVAMRWYLKASELESDFAQFRLGMMYADGVGVPANKAQAAIWMRKAADNGNDNAKKWLADKNPAAGRR